MARALKTPFGIRFKLVFLSSFLLVIPWPVSYTHLTLPTIYSV